MLVHDLTDVVVVNRTSAGYRPGKESLVCLAQFGLSSPLSMAAFRA